MSLKPGREMDALVAEKVMGLVPCSNPIGRCDAAKMTPCQCWGTGGVGSDLLSYSTDIAAAWEVLPHLGRSDRGYFVRKIDHYRWGEGEVVWEAGCIATGDNGEDEYDVLGEGQSGPEAICRAALKAVGYADQEAPTPV